MDIRNTVENFDGVITSLTDKKAVVFFYSPVSANNLQKLEEFGTVEKFMEDTYTITFKK